VTPVFRDYFFWLRIFRKAPTLRLTLTLSTITIGVGILAVLARIRYSMIAVVATSLAVSPLASQTLAYKAPRTPDGKPNLNGIWQALNSANWDIQDHTAAPGPSAALGAAGAVPPGQGVVEGDEIPYLPAAAMKRKENFAKRFTLDPEIQCYLTGVPRGTYVPYPFQIIQGSKTIMIAYQFAGAVRTIPM